MVNRIFKAIAMSGLIKEQKKLLEELAEYHMSFFQRIKQDNVDDIEITGAGMMSQSYGLKVVNKKLEETKERKKKTRELKQKCLKSGIKQWRIDMIT